VKIKIFTLGFYMLFFGISLDMITTIIGTNIGFTEGNNLGLINVYILNFVMLLALILFKKQLEYHKFATFFGFTFIIGGIFRIIIGIHNIFLMYYF
jgi:hypothetical protein